MTKKTIIILSTVFLTLCCIQLSAETIEDVPYLQEISVKIPSDEPIISVAVYKEKLYAAAKTALMVIENDKFTNTSCPAKNIRIIKTLKNTLWLISSDSLYKFDGKWKKIADGEFTDLCLHLGNVTVAAKRCLYYVKDDKLIEIENSKDPKEDIINIDSYSETLYVASETKLALFDCNSYDGVNVIDWGQLPFSDIRDIHRQQSRLYVATGKGIGLLRGMSMVTITGEDGLCYEDVTCLADGFEEDMWIGTTAGAIRCVNGEYQYFAADRWLLDNNVNSITADDKNVYIATNKGIGIIKYQPYTLCKKADYYEKYLNIWGHKRLGFVHKLEWDDQLNQWVRQVSDNDGGWTSHYISAMCFKYAVTGDSNARAGHCGRNSFATPMNMKDAIAHFKAVLEQSPEDELAMFSLGKACYEAGEYGEARENLMRAIDQKKDWMAAWILLGQCEMALGHRDAAREILQKAHQLAVIQNHRGPLAETKRLLAELDQDA